MKKIKISAADADFSRCVRIRDNWQCQRCMNVFEPNSQGIHASHFVGRSCKVLRFHPWNCCAHCHGCHSYLGSRPQEFSAWIDGYLGKKKARWLRQVDRLHVKLSQPDLRDIRAWYKAERKRLENEGGMFEVCPIISQRIEQEMQLAARVRGAGMQ